MSEIERQIGQAADYVAGKIDGAIDTVGGAVESVGDALAGETGKKVVGGAVVGLLAATVLPVSLAGGALLGAGYAAFRQFGRSRGEHEQAGHGTVDRSAD